MKIIKSELSWISVYLLLALAPIMVLNIGDVPVLKTPNLTAW